MVGRYEREFGNLYTFHGVDVEVPTNISVDLKNALLKDKYESEERGFVDAHLPDETDVIELGGSIGVVSAFTRSRMSPSARQIVIEAIPELAEICKKNIARQDNQQRSTVIQAAISYSGQDSIRFLQGDTPHVGRISQGEGVSIDVPVIELEQICADHKVDNFVLICDIEGAEIDLFEQSTIWQTACPLIILETHPRFYEGGTHAQKKLVELIKSKGFDQLGESRGVYAFGKATP